MLYFGTSGFSYKDWVGHFYPHGMPPREYLHYYAQEFNTLELNSTYYAIPSLSAVKTMIAKTEGSFTFSIKANQEMTHQRTRESKVFTRFVQMLDPFIDAGKFGCVLAQFPYSFNFNRLNQDYMEFFREKLGEIPVIVELRNNQWIKPEIFDWLRSYNLGFCCVDEPSLPELMPPVSEITSDIGYIRFHGRNASKWWQHEHAYERYDYTYSTEELKDWLPKILKIDSLAKNTFVFANNHWQGQAIDTIRQLRLMFD